jgi:multiple sugar transport system substrate-binding protein
MKRRLVLLSSVLSCSVPRCSILLCSLLLLFSSCGKKSDVVEVHFWNFGGTPNFIEWMRGRVETFNSTHPGTKVVVSDKSWHMIREILYANYSAGNGPDVMTLHANHAAEFGEANFFQPINRFPDFEEVRKWYVPNLIDATKYKGDYYGLPGSAIAFVLVCNKEMFDAEGIAPPKTWSQFREAARRLTKDRDGDGTIDQYGLVLMGGDKGGFSYRLAPFLFKAGVNILSEDLTTVEFNSPRGVATVRLFADMYQIDHSITPGFLAYTLSEMNDLFCGNKAAMSIEGPWLQGMVAEKSPGKEFYTVPVPVPDDMIGQYETAPTLQDMVMWAMNSRSKHQAEAWEFMKFMRGEEADMFWVRKDIGGIATTVRALNSPDVAARKDWAVYKNELKYARPWPPHPNIMPIAKNVITPYAEKAIIGELTPEAAWSEAAREAQLILEGKK